jgi:hypothetical protein
MMQIAPNRVRRYLAWAAGWCAILAAPGCSVGTGTGFVTSDRLFVDGCWLGTFNLQPNFFAANPYEDTLTIRVQRGERDIRESDGITMLVGDVPGIRTGGLLGTELPLGLPVGVSPIGYGLPDVPNPPAASMTLYLHNSCRGQNAELFAVDGHVIFEQLFSGDLNEDTADDRITKGSFVAFVVDPRDAMPRASTDADAGPAYTYPADRTSRVDGEFNFVFHRGTPAQPFP